MGCRDEEEEGEGGKEEGVVGCEGGSGWGGRGIEELIGGRERGGDEVEERGEVMGKREMMD